MATDAEKTQRSIQFMGGMIVSMAATAYNILGDSALSFGPPIGTATLNQWEKQMGLELAGETPMDVMTELARIYVDEYGSAESVDISQIEEGVYEVRVNHCTARGFTDTLIAATGMNETFMCPLQNTFKAALQRMGYKFKVSRAPLEDHGSVFTFEQI